MTKPSYIRAYGVQEITTADLPHLSAPARSVLPSSINSDSNQLADWSNLLLLSKDCARGVIVTVSNSPYVRTVGMAYDSGHTGLTALLLGHLKSGPPGAVLITVAAFRDGVVIGQAQLRF